MAQRRRGTGGQTAAGEERTGPRRAGSAGALDRGAASRLGGPQLARSEDHMLPLRAVPGGAGRDGPRVAEWIHC